MNIFNDPRQPTTATHEEVISSERREQALDDAYAEGRSDQRADDMRFLAFAYRKLSPYTMSNQDDALLLDEIKLILTGGI